MKQDRMRRAVQFAFDALSGRMGVLMMTLAYATFAVVLLAYVSTQVYTNSLMEDISALKQDERDAKERIVRLTADYASLSSRARISKYCETKLGMVQADVADVIRLSIDTGDDTSQMAEEFTEQPTQIPDVLGTEIGGVTGVMGE